MNKGAASYAALIFAPAFSLSVLFVILTVGLKIQRCFEYLINSVKNILDKFW